MTAVSYRRLPGKRRTLVSTSALHLGQDHILQVRSNRISEEYQRFYLQDVQGIFLRKTAPLHYVWSAVCVVSAILAARFSGDALWPFGILGAGGLLLWLRGPSCEVRLQTAVSSEHLRSLHRLKTAQRVLPILREHIESVQGQVLSAPEDYAAGSAPKPPPLPVSGVARPLAPQRRDHLYLFSFLACETLLLLTWLVNPARAVEQAIAAATLIEFLAIVIVLVRQAQQQIPALLRNVTYVALARWFLVQSTATGFAYKGVIIDHARTSLDPLTIVRGTLTYVTLTSLFAMSLTGLWVSLRDSNE